METIASRALPIEQIDALDAIAHDAPNVELQELLQSLVRCLREGDDIIAIDPQVTLTPNQAADRLGMSRTHLYKLLDSGAIEHHRVGRDRRIPFAALAEFEAKRQADRRELAERFAHRDRTREAATDEIADLL